MGHSGRKILNRVATLTAAPSAASAKANNAAAPPIAATRRGPEKWRRCEKNFLHRDTTTTALGRAEDMTAVAAGHADHILAVSVAANEGGGRQPKQGRLEVRFSSEIVKEVQASPCRPACRFSHLFYKYF